MRSSRAIMDSVEQSGSFVCQYIQVFLMPAIHGKNPIVYVVCFTNYKLCKLLIAGENSPGF